MLSDRIHAMRGSHWLLLFAVIAMAWLALFLMAIPAELRVTAALDQEFWRTICTLGPDGAGFAGVASMWVLMSAAMMAPTALPAFATYDDLRRQDGGHFGKLVLGYLVVWIGFSLLAAALQSVLFRADLLTATGDSRSRILSAILLLVAGLYQFSSIKEACLSKCRRPLVFFMQHWDEGPLKNGLRLGAVCLGCCWALMMLAFVGGVMNLAFMGLATVLMILEKLPDIGRWLTKPLGVLLICAAAWNLGMSI